MGRNASRPRAATRSRNPWHGAALLLTLLVITAARLPAAGAIRCEGVLGNSGADGDTLVQLNTDDPGGRSNDAGLGYDRLGRLWTFGGRERLIAYAPDGRMTAMFPLPSKKSERHTLVVTQDWVVMRAGEKLFRLPITAATGQAFEALTPTVRALSLNAAADGSVALIGTDGNTAIFKPADNSLRTMGQVAADARADNVVLMPDGSLLVDGAWRFREGRPPEKLKNTVAPFAQLAGEYIYTFTGHMTVARNNLALQPEPGTVYGGGAGYFIGSLPEDAELETPRGIAPLGDGRFAVAGAYGIVHIVTWNAERKAFDPVRRLGSAHFPAALAMNNAGRTWFFCGYWDWTDGPEHILRSPTIGDRNDANAQAGILPGGQVVYPVVSKGAAALQCRAFDETAKRTTSEVSQMPDDPTGLAVFPSEKTGSEIVIVNAKGSGVRLAVDGQNRFKNVLGPCAVQLTSATPSITSLAAPDGEDFLAADGGFVVRLRREGENFREVSRVNRLADATPLGKQIFLATAGKHLWVSDTENNRVIHAVMDGGKFSAATVFTGVSSGLATPLREPRRISAAGERAVVLDWKNQRIVKLSCAP